MSSAYFYFASPIYVENKPEYLNVVSEVSEEALSKITNAPDELYPMYNSENFANDGRLEEFCKFLAMESNNILHDQGYDMRHFQAFVDVMWAQKHYKHSAMEQHVHGGPQLVGFYFLNAPENCSKALFHDPRPAKMQNYLPELNRSEATLASGMINFEPEAGQIIISNAWTPHSFSRHGSDEPLKFVHFNIGAFYSPQESIPAQQSTPTAEVV